jgi:hypothetical protein
MASASGAQASVVTALSGDLEANVAACAFSPSAGADACVNDYHHVATAGQPTALATSSSAEKIGPFSSASLAADMKTTWASPDSGVVDINSLGLFFQDGTPDTFAEYFVTGGLAYRFTANEDAILTMTGVFGGFAQGDPRQGGRGVFWTVWVDESNDDVGTGLHHEVLGDFSDIVDLNAGVTYRLELRTLLGEDGGLDTSPRNITEVDTLHLTFDIAAAPTDAGPSGGAPEPATWGLMLAGFGAVGTVLRHRASRRGLGAMGCTAR